MDQASEISGTLHVHIAFDWGDEVDLERAKGLVRAEEHKLSRRRRTPSWIAYRPSPLTIPLGEASLDLPGMGLVKATAEATVFDFAGVSLDLSFPFRLLPDRLSMIAGQLAERDSVVKAAKALLEPLYKQLLPAIQQPLWSPLNEDYFVFHIPPAPPLPPTASLLDSKAGWLAGLVRMEANPLSTEEIAEAVRLHLSYSPDDLFVPDWAAAVLIDRDCDETLQTIEFANLLLLEFRHLDDRLAVRLAAAYKLIHPLARSWLPLWHTHHRSLRALGELKVEANSMIERPVNALKLVGDQYIARVYSLLAKRFHIEEWEQSIRRSLEVIEGVYAAISDQAATYRTEVLEVIVILLILSEILMAFLRH
jgi:hypothetical protein